MNPAYHGLRIVINDTPIGRKQFRFPKSKGRRIRKKWTKKPGNFKPIFLEHALVDRSSNTVVLTSRMAEQLRRAAAQPTKT